jgi:hypothetical protein
LLFFEKAAGNSGKTASTRLFLRSPNRQSSWISAVDEMSMADNLLQKTAKTASLAIR